jgi:hypothetical protein
MSAVASRVLGNDNAYFSIYLNHLWIRSRKKTAMKPMLHRSVCEQGCMHEEALLSYATATPWNHMPVSPSDDHEEYNVSGMNHSSTDTLFKYKLGSNSFAGNPRSTQFGRQGQQNIK